MILRLAISVLVPLSLFMTACSEKPSTPVAPAPVEEVEVLTKEAVVYEGRILKQNAVTGEFVETEKLCTLNFTVIEEDGGHYILAALGETVHGQNLSAMELDPYYLSLNDGIYGKAKPLAGDYKTAMVGLALSDEDIEPDVNQIQTYADEGNLLLEQSMEFIFKKDMLFTEFEEEVEEIVETKIKNLSNKSTQILNQLERVFIHVKHTGHVDPRFCGGFSLKTATTVFDFPLGLEHDHDDGHGH